ncbi:hypothetical protein KFU94_65130 [Chloroflexi bacterium TSY]|nr:hypothetical protein [Chloroflexi bacterium TSY]
MCNSYGCISLRKFLFALFVGFIASFSLAIPLVQAQTPTCSLDAFDEASLNQAIACANGAGSGSFVIQITGNISLTQATLPIDSSTAIMITIQGNGFTVDGQGISGVRVFEVRSNTTVQINNLTITGGNVPGDGGGLFVHTHAKVFLAHSTIFANRAQRGGGIFNAFEALICQTVQYAIITRIKAVVFLMILMVPSF